VVVASRGIEVWISPSRNASADPDGHQLPTFRAPSDNQTAQRRPFPHTAIVASPRRPRPVNAKSHRGGRYATSPARNIDKLPTGESYLKGAKTSRNDALMEAHTPITKEIVTRRSRRIREWKSVIRTAGRTIKDDFIQLTAHELRTPAHAGLWVQPSSSGSVESTVDIRSMASTSRP